MVKEIDSKMMKRAVEQLFNYEINRNQRVSSHSQLERWIVGELKMYSNPVSAKALQLVLKDLRGIDFDYNEPDGDIDVAVEAEIRLRGEYKSFGFYKEDTGGGCTSMTRNDNDTSSYVMVTQEDGADAPDNLLDPVLLGFYDGGGNLLTSVVFISTFEMFASDFFKWLTRNQ